ncbi:hypothetical protein NON00_08065 [Roseomonas sp. GC11]|uniref:V4R domain-containing protein n=1 Tax=Roseomonas sp. GC11 TaxID=2950546 RepID=UPI002108C462|nr:hypothetical protein [Roseomonas sp. GC11]
MPSRLSPTHEREGRDRAGAGHSPRPVCHAVSGILAAMGPYVLGAPVHAVEMRCAACDGGAECLFRVALSPEGDLQPSLRAAVESAMPL